MERVGSPCPQNRMRAAPPRAVNTGAPSRMARPSSTSAGTMSCSGSNGNPTASAARPAASALATRRSRHPEPACQIRRSATRAKPTGSTSWTTHTGIPYTSTLASGRIAWVYSKLAMHRNRVTAAATPLLMSRAADLARPLRKVVTVDSDSSRFSRAAMAPPNMPTNRHMCCTMVLEPEMPVRNKARSTISASGSTTSAASGSTTSRFSPPTRARNQAGRAWPGSDCGSSTGISTLIGRPLRIGPGTLSGTGRLHRRGRRGPAARGSCPGRDPRLCATRLRSRAWAR